MEFDSVIKKRASIRNYSSKKVSPEDIIDCIAAAEHAPSPGNLQLLTYIVIDDKSIIEKLALAAQQEFIEEAPFVVVICSNSKQIKRLYEERADRYLKHHTGAAIENFLLKVTDLGLASCWIGAFFDEQIKEILHITDDFEVEAMLPVAYESSIRSRTKQRQKHDLRNRIFFNNWKNKFFKKPIQISSFDRQ